MTPGRVLCTAWLACLILATPALTEERSIDDAVALVHAGKGADARAAFAELVKTGNAEAIYHLGALHHAGIGGDPDLTRAVHWYEKAAQAGVVEAKLALGSLLYKGKGIPRDLARALILFTEAAEAGLLSAQYNLAMMHIAGLAHTKEYNADEDKPRAYKWFKIVLTRLDDEDARANVEAGIKFLVKDMTPWEIEQGEEMAAQWLAAHGKGGSLQ